jgi:hypothetical protein
MYAEETERRKKIAQLEAWLRGVDSSVDTSNNSSSEKDSDIDDYDDHDDLAPFAFGQLQRFIVESKALETF